MSQQHTKPNNVGLSKLSILGALVLMLTVAIGGVAIRPEKSVEIFGFASLSVIGLMSMLRAEKTAEKVAEVKQDTEALSIKTDAQAQAHQAVLLEIKTDVNSNSQKMIEQQRVNALQVAALQNKVADLKVDKALLTEKKKEGG